MSGPGPRIRTAERHDLPVILELVHALAAYEREPDAVKATPDDFARALFPDHGAPAVFCHVAEVEGEVVGLAVWFVSFSTWTGQHGIWLEDLFVLPGHRGAGLGKALLQRLAQICLERDWARLEWWVLDWNAPSIAFYESLGAQAQDEWTTFRMTGEALTALGSAER